jgi:ABC-type glycerol-3-phosphate transport system substrate-binding protein
MNRAKALNRRSFLKGLALVLGVGAAGGCAQATPGAPSPAPAGATPGGFQGTIEFWDWAYDPRVAFMEELVAE